MKNAIKIFIISLLLITQVFVLKTDVYACQNSNSVHGTSLGKAKENTFHCYNGENISYKNYKGEKTYVEVDKDAQHCYMFQDGILVWESDCVTGMPIPSKETHEGCFKITQKRTDKIIRGSYGERFVNRWMRFNDWAEGFHDSPWREVENGGNGVYGGTEYVENGSYGCVNLPLDKAIELYDLVSVGTIVVIH